MSISCMTDWKGFLLFLLITVPTYVGTQAFAEHFFPDHQFFIATLMGGILFMIADEIQNRNKK